MKVCVLFLLLVAYQSSANHVTVSQVRNRWKGTVAAVASECVPRSKVKQEVIDEFFRFGKMPDDHSFKCYLHCNGFELQVFNSAGEISPKHLMEHFDYIDPQLAQKCAGIIEPDHCHKAYLLVKCLLDDLSVRSSF